MADPNIIRTDLPHSIKLMSDLAQILSSEQQYEQAFEEGLIRILKQRTAGTFILACANLFSHPKSLARHQTELHSVFDYLRDHYRDLAQLGEKPTDAPDDIKTMDSLLRLGLDEIDPVVTRRINNTQCQFLLNYNPLRHFRPARMSKVAKLQLNTPFNPDGFHFNKPFLEKEIFAEGEMLNRQVSLFYNKFPIVEHHAMLVVDRRSNRNQYLSKEDLYFIAELQASLQVQNPHLVIAFNSLGAGASVNHLHFHCFIEQEAFPIFCPIYTQNGGDRLYPANCHVTNEPDAAWSFVTSCHENNIAYNLLFRDGKIFYLPRKPPQRTIEPFDLAGFGWSHMAGFFNIDNPDDLPRITFEQVVRALHAVSP